jgi:phospholipid/cholesterol/gamma-HCH transport system ATP-binding protein
VASAAIELQNIELVISGETLLRQVNLQIAKGESFVLIGPSGQGKSVLMKVMAGLISPTSGRVLIHGKDLYAANGTERLALIQKMGMLFQKNALFDSLNVAQNVAFPLLEVEKTSSSQIAERVDSYLKSVDLLAARTLFPSEISGGMQKRLGIARALALRPEIAFFDEPTAGLDPITSRKIARLILDLREQMGVTAITITSDMARAYQLAQRIAVVFDGELIVTGTPAETRANSDPRVQQFIHGNLLGPLTVNL